VMFYFDDAPTNSDEVTLVGSANAVTQWNNPGMNSSRLVG